MINFRTFLFPDPKYELIAVACYIIVFIVAYQRFNSLVKDYSSYNAPGAARPWTTYLRYHAAAAVYSCFYLLLFTFIYQLFHRHPSLVNIVYRVLAWRESDAFDWQKFPEHPLEAAPTPFYFDQAPDERVAALFEALAGVDDWDAFLEANDT